MTEKQLNYIDKLFSHSISIGKKETKHGTVSKYLIKPYLMKQKMLTFNQELTQLFIDYGKAWKEWDWYQTKSILYEIQEETSNISYYGEISDALGKQADILKKVRKLEKQIEIELDKLDFGSYYNNLLN